MQLTTGSTRRAGLALGAAIALLAGCAGDIAGELSRNVHVREQVMSAIAADSTLSGEMTQRLLADDTHRRQVVETVLADDPSARYVLTRIGRSSEAVDYVLQAAASDSAGRVHLMTLLKGMQLAMHGAK
jgi:Tfp pilus assembly major pilin PilA